MKKRFFTIIALVFMMVCLCSCESSLTITPNGNEYNFELSLDNSIIKATDNHVALFEANEYEASLNDNILTINGNISIVDKNDLNNKISILNQILITINPDIKKEVNDIELGMEQIINGYSFSGTQILRFTLNTNSTDYGTINVVFNADVPHTINGQDVVPNGNSIELPAGLEDSSFDINIMDNSNISKIEVTTNDTNDKISSNIKIEFKENINEDFAKQSLERARIEDVEISKKRVNFSLTYETPEMFNALHTTDLYNLFGGIYKVSLDNGGIYNKKGSLSISVLDNNGIDVTYNMISNNKPSSIGASKLQEGQTYLFEYGAIDGGNIIVTLVVGLSIAIVIGIIVVLFKRENK